MGGIVEEFIEAPETASPSAQLRIDPAGEVLPLSTHDQILGGTSGQVFLGCGFPADESLPHAHAGGRASRSARSWPATASSAASASTSSWGAAPGEDWKIFALEINLRMGGTTHPYLALQFLTGGHLDPDTGAFRSSSRPDEVLPRDGQPARRAVPRPLSRRTSSRS